MLRERGLLHREAPDAELAAALSFLVSPESYTQLVLEYGWSEDAYAPGSWMPPSCDPEPLIPEASLCVASHPPAATSRGVPASTGWWSGNPPGWGGRCGPEGHAGVMTDNVIEVHDLRKDYGDHAAVDGISFDIRRGETFALLGPNGAGKSTTIEILEGYRHRTSGDVRRARRGSAEGRAGLESAPRHRAAVHRRGGLLHRPRAAHRVRRLLPRPARRRRGDRRRRARAEATHPRGRLSGGQQRRLDVALGIIGHPELLFLDEPTTGFDPEARRQFWGLIRALKAEGTSILLTTHYLDEAAQLGDRAAVIVGGRIAAIGAIDEIGDEEARTPMVRWIDSTGARREERTTEPGKLVAHLSIDG